DGRDARGAVGHGLDLGVDLALARELAQVVAQDVASDPKHEGPKRQALADPLAVLDQDQEGLLDQILGSGRDLVAEESRDCVGVTIEQLGSGRLVTGSPGVEQLGVDAPVAGHVRVEHTGSRRERSLLCSQCMTTSAALPRARTLDGLDASFLYAESANMLMHTLKVAVLEPGSATLLRSRADWVLLRRRVAEVADRLPPLRRRLVSV